MGGGEQVDAAFAATGFGDAVVAAHVAAVDVDHARLEVDVFDGQWDDFVDRDVMV